jgi:hypothetical protein
MKNCLQIGTWVPQVSILRPGIRTSFAVGLRLALAAMTCLLWPSLLHGQSDAALANQQKAHAVLAATIQALGGPAWLDLRTSRCRVRIAAFVQGNPTGEVSEAIASSELPDKERIDSDNGRVVQIFSGSSGWEITYKGKKDLPAEKLEEYLRWRKYSLRSVLSQWFRNPSTVLIDQGPSQIDTHRTEKITLINSGNDAVTLEIDTESRLPLRLSFTWRDPQFHDKNTDAVEYDNYHRVDGIATPFTVTQTHNGEIVHQRFVLLAEDNIGLQENLFDPDYTAAHLKR